MAASAGWLGVSLFFVLSGFLLAVRYAPVGAMRTNWRDFWAARVARLAPTYVVAMAFALPLFLRDLRYSGTPPADGAVIAVAAATLQQAWRPEWACAWNCPSWSLSVEAWFYLVFPVLVPLLAPLTRTRAGSIGLLAGALGASFMTFPSLERFTADWTLPIHALSPLARWPEFVAGIALAGVARGSSSPASPWPGHRLLASGLAWLVAAVTLRGALEAWGLHLLPVALPGFVLIIAGAWRLRAAPAGLLAHPGSVRLGEASYALYLFHGPLHSYMLAAVNRVVGRGYDTSWWIFATYLPLAIGLSVAIERWFETPARRALRARFGLTGESR
jgi:peptidoglycan/LPS O-acetylase OafA/YrhL